MLLKRSICLQICLFLTISQCNSQEYESSYDESDDGADVEDDSGDVDYSKYYSVDTSAPLTLLQGNQESVFTKPIDFAGIDFGASTKQETIQPKNPFVAQSTNGLGFVASPQAFPDFSSTGPFHVDYFEEAQKSQQQENQEDGEPNNFEIPNPSYISYNIPQNLEGGYSSDVKKVEPKPIKPAKPVKNNKNKKKYKYKDADKEASADNDKYNYEYEPSSAKFADYNTGKSSSTVSQHPQAPGFFEVPQTPTPSPYQKYSFKPVTEESSSKYLEDLISTVAPFNPAYSKVASTATPAFETQSSEHIPSHLKDKNCRRVRKHIPGDHGRRKREAMNCFICEDPANSAKFTQCSYAVEPEPKNDYSGVSERYSTPSQEPDGFRYKRYSGDDFVDPYEYIKKRTHKNYEDSQKVQEYEEYKIPDFYQDGPDKSYSEAQSEAITKNAANCHKEESKGMTCTICKDPKTGGNFEQCSYNSAPKAQKYAYVTEKKFDSNEPNEGSESKTKVQTKRVEPPKESKKNEPEYKAASDNNDHFTELKNFKPKEQYNTGNFEPSAEYKAASNKNDKFSKLESFKPIDDYKANYKGHDKFKLSDAYNSNDKSTGLDNNNRKEEYNPSSYPGADKTPKKLIDDEPYDIPKHFAESTIREQKTGVRGLEPSLYGSSDSSEQEGDADSYEEGDNAPKSDPYKDIDEYHFRLFPEFSNQESQQSQVVTGQPSVENNRKDVEEVLAEFSKKDRSSCKKAEKKGMTCYLCVDKKGIQHEECMYVSESKPQASHVAYHEVQQIKSPENKEQEQFPAASENKETPLVQIVSSTSAPYGMQAAASEEVESKVKYNPKRNNKSRRKNVKKPREPVRSSSNVDSKLLKDGSDPKTPVEFVVGEEEGAFSAETRPVYSKTLGVKLPRYMIERSEFEKEFDEFSGNY